MPREMLKLRKGDCAIKFKKDGSVELAGVGDKPMVDSQGNINPVILFAAAWAKKDPDTMKQLVENFRNSVREGYFGDEAKRDFTKMEDAAREAEKPMTVKQDTGNQLAQEVGKATIQEPVLDPESKPRVIDHDPIGNEFETHSDVASGAVTLTDGGCGNADSDSGAVTFEQPKPYDKDGMLKGRDS